MMNWLKFQGFAGHSDEISERAREYFETHEGVTAEEALRAVTEAAEDVFPDSRLVSLIERADSLEESWWDSDPSVSWDMEAGESRYGSLAAIYIEAGWEKCYHRDGARFHFPVKLRSGRAWRAFRAILDEAGVSDSDYLDDIAQNLHDGRISDFWEWELREAIEEFSPMNKGDYYSCGRSSGYVNAPNMETDAEAFLRLAQFLTRAHSYYDGVEFAEEIAREAVDEYRERKLAALASPRIERVEA